jgi:hypothetical protein
VEVLVGCSWRDLSDPENIEPTLAERADGRTREVLVGEKLHAVSSG